MFRAKQFHSSMEEAELDITAFMNLMIVLVPVLLMSMVFSRIAILELKLPDGLEERIENAKPEDELALSITKEKFTLFFPQNVVVKEYDQGSVEEKLSDLVEDLKQIKSRLNSKGVDKDAITLMPEDTISYQMIVSVMDAVRSYEAVVATSVVDAELFPNISFLNDASDPLAVKEAR